MFFLLALSLTSKKLDRYLLPVFPLIDILAAIGLSQTVKIISNKRSLKVAIIAIFIMFQALSSLPLHPYYLSYYSPIIGPSRAPKIMMVGWGEGLEKSAEYLNQKGDENLIVAASYPQVFRVFFEGEVIDINDAPMFHSKIDYYVFYINKIQREVYFEDFLMKYTEEHPEHIVEINGIPYVWIYKKK